MYEFKISSSSTIWWNFLTAIKPLYPDINDKTSKEQLDAINQSLYEYRGECSLNPSAMNKSKVIVHFDTEEDFMIFKLKFV